MLRPRAAYLPMSCVPCPRVTSGASLPTGNTVARSREDAPEHLYGTRCDVAAVLRRRTAARVRLERSELISIARAAIPSHPAVRGPAHADGLLVGDEKRERRQWSRWCESMVRRPQALGRRKSAPSDGDSAVGQAHGRRTSARPSDEGDSEPLVYPKLARPPAATSFFGFFFSLYLMDQCISW